MKNKTKLTLLQAGSFIIACVLILIFYDWKLIPIFILFGWANNASMTKMISSTMHKAVKESDKGRKADILSPKDMYG